MGRVTRARLRPRPPPHGTPPACTRYREGAQALKTSVIYFGAADELPALSRLSSAEVTSLFADVALAGCASCAANAGASVNGPAVNFGFGAATLSHTVKLVEGLCTYGGGVARADPLALTWVVGALAGGAGLLDSSGRFFTR